jgi:hypothetical protein
VSDQPRVVVCRGCCCGTPRKHPDTDHGAQLRTLRTRLGADAVRTSDCLGPCGEANVTVVLPSRAGRLNGGRPTWLGFVLSDAAIADVTAWIDSGGPGLAPIPATLDLHRITPLPHRAAPPPGMKHMI